MVHKHFVSHDGIGYVALIDSMPSQANMDEAIVTAARVSYDSSSTTTVRGTEGLLRFCYGTTTLLPSKWSSSNSLSECHYSSLDSTSDTELPV